MATPNPVPAPARASPATTPTFARRTITTGVQNRPKRLMVYGPGGVGKSQLASLAPDVLVLDLEGSTSHLDIARIDLQRATFPEIRAVLQDRELLAPYKTIAIDTLTKLEEIAAEHTVATVPHEKGHPVADLLGYGFGKGLEHLYNVFLPILMDCDRLIDSGKHVFLISQQCVEETPNPNGEDFLAYEPRLQRPKSGKHSVRDRVFEWCDVVGYLSFDVSAKDGKGRGAGTRTLYFDARPTWRAKGRGGFAKIVPWNNLNDGKEVLACLN